MWRAFATILARDLRLAMRQRGELAQPLVFFAAVATLFPLALGPERELLQRIAPGIAWVAALLAVLLPMERIFRPDFDDGTLEQMLLSPHPAELLALAKVIAHWLVTCVPVIVLAPLIALVLQLPVAALPTLLASLALGTPVLALVGAIGVALTVGLRSGGPLLALLLLPLYIPVLIFAAGAVDRAAADMTAAGPLYVLAAMLVLALTLAPPAIAASLRISLS
ncbi:MAG: heme exporter protein CcmB [Halofilum sp. (in: g-proteobacteria)]|nr:heme exporter protein CcmB [Halofilum sp. (in: g-proteobacteria)]